MKTLSPITAAAAHILCAELEIAIAEAAAERDRGYFPNTNTGLIEGFSALHAELCERGSITRPLPRGAA